MKKNSLTFIVFLIVALIAAAIITQLLAPVGALSFLTKSAEIAWQPRADFHVVEYDISLKIRLNIISILAIIGAIWIYRKL